MFSGCEQTNRSNFIHPSIAGAFPVTKTPSLIEQLILPVYRHFLWWLTTNSVRSLFARWPQLSIQGARPDISLSARETPFWTSVVLAPLVARIRKSSSSFSKFHHTRIFLPECVSFSFLFFSVYEQYTFLAFIQCFEEVSFISHIIVKDPRSIFAMLTWEVTWIFTDWLFLYMYLCYCQLIVLLVYILSCWRQIFAMSSKLTWATTTYFVCTLTKLSFPA